MRRLFLRSRGFTIVSVVTLAVGVGSTSAIFSAVNPVLLQPLSFPEPDRLLQVGGVDIQRDRGLGALSELELAAIESGTTAFEFIAGCRQLRVPGPSGDADGELRIWYVTGDYFALLGLRPQLGRLFSASERNVVVLSDTLWRTRYSSDPNVLGQRISLSRAEAQIVGVAEPVSHVLPLERTLGSEVWTPLERGEQASSGARNRYVTVRLSAASTIENAQIQLDTVSARLARESAGAMSSRKLRVLSVRDATVTKLRPILAAAFAIALAVLLIGVGNLTNLQIVRNQQRVREFAVRTAIGASQRDLLRLGLAESVVLCGTGGTFGFVLAAVSGTAMATLLPRNPFSDEIKLDFSVVAFSIGLSAAGVVVLTLLPRVRPTLDGLWPFQGEGDPDPRQRRLLRQGIVGAEFGLALSAVFVAGLLLNSFWRLNRVNLGFQSSGVAVLYLDRLRDVYENVEAQTQFLAQTATTLRAIDGVEAVGVTSFLPLSGQSDTRNSVTVDGLSVAPEFQAGYRSTNAAYFRALGVAFVAGEAYTDTPPGGEPVAVVNAAFARRMRVSSQSVVGRRLKLGRHETQVPWRRILGIVGDVRERYNDDAVQPEVFVPINQDFQFGRANLVVRSVRPASEVLAQMRNQIDERLLSKAGPRGTSMDELLRAQLSPERSRLWLLGSVALVACSLSLIGIYGVVSYAALRRTKEIGIRAALGASPLRIVGYVVQSEALVSFGVGLFIGPLLALSISRYLGTMLYGLPPHDPWTLAAVTLVTGALVGVASALPALRVSHLDLAGALRSE